MKVAVVGGGLSGLAAAYELAKSGAKVVVFEKESCLGGHCCTAAVAGVDIDFKYIGFNQFSYPNMVELVEELGVEMEAASKMSFSVSLEKGKGYEWGSRDGLAGLFAQRSNFINPYFWHLLQEIFRFKKDVIKYLEVHEGNHNLDCNETLELFIKSHGYSGLFQKAYLIPICASIWSCSSGVMNFSAYSVLSYLRNHHLLQVYFNSVFSLLAFGNCNFFFQIRTELERRSCVIKLGSEVKLVSSAEKGCSVLVTNLEEEFYDGCIISLHAPDALELLGKQKTYDESRILGAYQYVYSDTYLHHDENLMPRNPSAWSSWNFLGTAENDVCVTYWLNVLQNLGSNCQPLFVTHNPPYIPKTNLRKWTTSRPIPSVAASKASLDFVQIQGKRRIWFCGSYQGIYAGLLAVNHMLGREFKLQKNHMVLSLLGIGARLIVTKFLESYVSTGSLTLLEEGGDIFVFQGTNKRANAKSTIKVRDPCFYWKIATEADIGLADAYINGYVSFVDEKYGLLNFLLVLISNRDMKNSFNNNHSWWTPFLLTSIAASAKYFMKHISRSNSLSKARHNISLHYDLSNEFFSLFLDETMQYSCAIFKNESEDLRVAQLRKVYILINKAKIEAKHEILEIGCGWGCLAIEVVKSIGCKYTGISLSVEQLNYSQRRVREAGLEGKITLLLCDYRKIPTSQKYDRIISCLCLQCISIPDQRFEEYRRSSDFMKEYIFPGGCIPSLSRITSAMASSSKLCVEHLENIGIHYYQTLMHWRTNLLSNKSKILALGFDEKFIRTWEYYFLYCAAGFKSRTLGDYQVRLSF
ncbi:putative (S)-tetrahydroprotoberberine N-methyltransferase 2 [Apostasia shenzhenica]|uniref:Putative (S)-tetrahydroprotoberberine N-methyltransferase 2 n=1 Tax=Apostasia shenzhenica TaxID=1088818 RepID=A0A2I0AT39_9ASPA|nr:putative (S)-tetrahydroprotoberberine N-methyltransferase 2 [Apostasia shenzhenica]